MQKLRANPTEEKNLAVIILILFLRNCDQILSLIKNYI